MAYPLLLHAYHSPGEVAYETFGEWIVPWRFTGFEEEYAALRVAAGLIDYSTQAFIQVSGADRTSFLHNLLTNDIKRLTQGHGCRAALLTANAKCIADLIILADTDSLSLVCDANRASTVTDTLNHYLFSEDVRLANQERSHAVIAVQGPASRQVLEGIVGNLPPLADPYDHAFVKVEGVHVRVVRLTLAGGDGFACCVAVGFEKRFWELCRNIKPVGWQALNTARIEAGLPWFGIDFDETNLLPETGLEKTAVSDTKGCYLGQEIIARLATYGSVNKKLVCFKIDGQAVPDSGDAVFCGKEEAGLVTSACWSALLKQPVALGYVKRPFYAAETAVVIAHKNQRLSGKVAGHPPATLASSGQTLAGG